MILLKDIARGKKERKKIHTEIICIPHSLNSFNRMYIYTI